MEVQRRGRERLYAQRQEVGRWRRAWGHWVAAFALLTLVTTLVVAPVTEASATPQALSTANSSFTTQGSFVTAGSNGLTTATASLGQAGDLLVIWVKSRFLGNPPIDVANINQSGTGVIGTPVKAIQYYTVDHPSNDDEIWYAPVTSAGTITLTFTWSGSNSSDFSEYSTQEFQPSTPSTYSLDTKGHYENNTMTVTMQFPSLTPAGTGELYAGYNSNNTSGTYTSPTSGGYTADGTADNDAIVFDPDVSSSTQSPITTATSQVSTQSSIGALIISNPIHTVTFNANGGTGSMSPEIDSAPTALSPNDYANTGFTFSGWNTVANGSGTSYANGASYPFTADATLYAQWTADYYNVTFNGNGSTSGSMIAENDNAQTALTINTFVRTGYTFSGWNTAANGSGTSYADGASYLFTAPLTLYAQWTADYYNVTFNGNGSTSGTMGAENHNASTVLTTNTFVRTGYIFSGWNTAATGSGTSYADGASYSFIAAATLYAQWTADYFNVTFAGNGSTSGATNTESANTSTALTTNTFVKTGYTFSGWNTATNGSGTSYANRANYPFTSAVTLYAQWKADYFKVTFKGNGSTSGAMKVESANVPKALSANTFSRTGYTFAYWSTSANGRGAKFANRAKFPFKEGVTLYAKWTAVVPHALRIIGSVIVGQSRHVTIVGTGFFNGLHVKSNERGTAVRVLKAGVTKLLLTVTVGKGSPLGRHTFTIVTASKKTCIISYMTRR